MSIKTKLAIMGIRHTLRKPTVMIGLAAGLIAMVLVVILW